MGSGGLEDDVRTCGTLPPKAERGLGWAGLGVLLPQDSIWQIDFDCCMARRLISALSSLPRSTVHSVNGRGGWFPHTFDLTSL